LSKARALTDLDEMVAEILVLRAQIETEQGKFGEAEISLHEAERVAPPEELAAAWGNLSLLRHDAAVAERFFRQALKGGRETSALHRGLGEALAAMKRYPDAEMAFRTALATAATEGEREASYVDLAICFQQQERETECRRILHEATDRIP